MPSSNDKKKHSNKPNRRISRDDLDLECMQAASRCSGGHDVSKSYTAISSSSSGHHHDKGSGGRKHLSRGSSERNVHKRSSKGRSRRPSVGKQKVDFLHPI